MRAKYGFKVHTAYIGEVKRELGLPMYDAPNAVEELDDLDKQKALNQLLAKLTDAEKSIRKDGTISADELEAELGI